jgi:hypothetical protein
MNNKSIGHIGTLRESSLHSALKEWYARPGDMLEHQIDGYQIDIVRSGSLIEIQTGNFASLKLKLANLLTHHKVRVIYPIAVDRWIRRITVDDAPVGRRKSPKHGRLEELFSELLYIPHVALDPNFSLEVAMIREEVVWRDDGKGSWRRRRWSVADRLLLEVVERHEYCSLEDYLCLLPTEMPQPFTNQDLSQWLNVAPRLAQKMTYCLRRMNAIELSGKRGRANLYKTIYNNV